MIKLLVSLILIILAPLVLQADKKNEDFPQFNIKGIQFEIPVNNADIAKRNISIHLDARVPAFSSVFQYTGNHRVFLPDRLKKIDLLNMSGSYGSFVKQYEKEIEVKQEGKKYWIPIQNKTLEVLNQLVKKEGEFLAYLRYFGCCFTSDPTAMNDNRIYFIVGFTTQNYKKLEKSSCFSDSLAGIKLGMNMNEAIHSLTEKYGPPEKNTDKYGKTIYQFLPKESKFFIAITHATIDYTKKVYLIQVTGVNRELLLFEKLKLGEPITKVPRLDLTNLKEEPPVDGIRTYFESGSPCSIQTLDDKIHSVQIVEDKNFISD